MYPRSLQKAILALLLAAYFLGAQFHFCTEFSTAPASSHLCPICSATNSAMTAQALSSVIASVSDRLENTGTRFAQSANIPPDISPRAPPPSETIR
jgi:hypothetical protein